MAQIKAAITAVGGYVPKDILSNKDLEKMVDTTDEWILSRTGIKERRVLKGKEASDMGAEIVKTICQQSGTKPESIDLIICCTMTGDTIMPDTANTISYKAKAVNAFGFDLNAACSGFLFGLVTGAQYVGTGMYSKVIVLGLDVMSSIINYNDRTTCVIFGDGGGGVLLEPSKDETGYQDAFLKGNGFGREFLQIKAGGSSLPASSTTIANRMHYFLQDGQIVFKHAVKNMTNAIKTIMERNELNSKDIQFLVPHQANMRIIKSVSRLLDFPIEKVIVNIENYGNTTAGTIPLCLWDYKEKFKKGDNIIFTAFGAGFTWGAVYLKWSIPFE